MDVQWLELSTDMIYLPSTEAFVYRSVSVSDKFI